MQTAQLPHCVRTHGLQERSAHDINRGNANLEVFEAALLGGVS